MLLGFDAWKTLNLYIPRLLLMSAERWRHGVGLFACWPSRGGMQRCACNGPSRPQRAQPTRMGYERPPRRGLSSWVRRKRPRGSPNITFACVGSRCCWAVREVARNGFPETRCGNIRIRLHHAAAASPLGRRGWGGGSQAGGGPPHPIPPRTDCPGLPPHCRRDPCRDSSSPAPRAQQAVGLPDLISAYVQRGEGGGGLD